MKNITKNNTNKKIGIKLNVFASYTKDVGHNYIRIDQNSRNVLGVKVGDVLKIKGKRETVGTCYPLRESDENKKIIRMDGITRNNARIDEGDTVTVRKAEIKIAKHIELTALDKISFKDEKSLVSGLSGFCVISGDDAMIQYFGKRIVFQITKTEPEKGPVLIKENTACTINEIYTTETSTTSYKLPHISYTNPIHFNSFNQSMDPITLLERVYNLKENNIITEVEFKETKKKLLERI